MSDIRYQQTGIRVASDCAAKQAAEAEQNAAGLTITARHGFLTRIHGLGSTKTAGSVEPVDYVIPTEVGIQTLKLRSRVTFLDFQSDPE